jgi:deazaflavin-dependent oxidoreductase (nitroreductase family)
MTADSAPRNIQSNGAMNRIFNKTVQSLTRHGISIWGSRVLAVRGRSSGEWRTTPVNPLTLDGQRYLVAPRGHTQWVRNMRVAGGGELRVGRRVERFSATELADQQKPDVLRAYLKRWKFEVGMFFNGVGPDASDEQLLAIAPGYPVCRITEQEFVGRSTTGSARALPRWHRAAGDSRSRRGMSPARREPGPSGRPGQPGSGRPRRPRSARRRAGAGPVPSG